MPNQFSFDFDAPSEKSTIPFPTPAGDEEVAMPLPVEEDNHTVSLPFVEESATQPNETPATEAGIPEDPNARTVTEIAFDDRMNSESLTIQECQDVKDFKKNGLAYRLKEMDRIHGGGDIFVTMFQSLDASSKDRISGYLDPQIIRRQLIRTYHSLRRIRDGLSADAPSETPATTVTPHPRSQFQSPPQRGPKGGGRGSAIPDDN